MKKVSARAQNPYPVSGQAFQLEQTGWKLDPSIQSKWNFSPSWKGNVSMRNEVFWWRTSRAIIVLSWLLRTYISAWAKICRVIATTFQPALPGWNLSCYHPLCKRSSVPSSPIKISASLKFSKSLFILTFFIDIIFITVGSNHFLIFLLYLFWLYAFVLRHHLT